ncbi:MAG: endonuclease [Leeuwenhoekiella sp.]|nr:MAG: endonuclease [Leeuwenhoekiella sp.]
MYFVYILESLSCGRNYVGFTQDLNSRLEQHNRENVASTKPFRPWKIIYSEEKETQIEARKREKYLKTAAGRRWRNKMGM